MWGVLDRTDLWGGQPQGPPLFRLDEVEPPAGQLFFHFLVAACYPTLYVDYLLDAGYSALPPCICCGPGYASSQHHRVSMVDVSEFFWLRSGHGISQRTMYEGGWGSPRKGCRTHAAPQTPQT